MRPQRLYKTDKGRYYFIIDGIRKYIQIPKGMTEEELLKLNIKTILKLYGKRLKRRKKRKIPTLEKPIIKGEIGKLTSLPNLTASSGYVEKAKPIVEIKDIISGRERKRREQYLDDLSVLARSSVVSGPGAAPPMSTIGGPAVSVGPLPMDASVGPSHSQIGSVASTPSGTPASSFAGRDLKTGSSLGVAKNKNKPLRNEKNIEYKALTIDTFQKPTTDDKVEFGKIGEDYTGYTLPDARKLAKEQQETRTKARGKELEKLAGKYEYDNPPEPTPPKGTKPIYTKPSRAKMQEYLKKGETGLMPSSQIKPLSVEEKLASTPSYSGTPQGTAGPAIPLSSNVLSSPMPVSVAEQVRNEFNNRMFGTGGVAEGGLYNDEIAKIIRKRVGHIVPVVPSDKVNTLLDYVVKGDKKFAAVVNTNPSSSDGSGNDGNRPGHWRAIYINNEDDFPSVEYFDPLTEGPPEQSLVNIMRKLCKKISPENLCLYKENKIRRQAKEKSTCGWHTLQFIDDRWNGVPFSEASGYDHYIENLPTPIDDSVDGEKEVSKYIKKYKVYL